jgi:hypothetical protein
VVVSTQMPYTWIDEWAQVPDPGTDWAHAGIAVDRDGAILTTHPNGRTLLRFDPEGTLVGSVETELLELHYLHVASDGVWATDVGFKRHVNGAAFDTTTHAPRVVRLGADGSVTAELLPPYTDDYSPTAVVVDPRGGVWVADGYGKSLVHRYAADGTIDLTLEGFRTPHSLAVIDDLLVVCDRANGRLQEYTLDGDFVRTLAEGIVVTPTDIVSVGDLLVLTDFTAGRITVLTRDGALVEHLFEGGRVKTEDGWPNARDAAGKLVRPAVRPGAVNSPHTLAADADGNLYVSEWMIGGRTTKLAA